jgi:hypothetical protein
MGHDDVVITCDGPKHLVSNEPRHMIHGAEAMLKSPLELLLVPFGHPNPVGNDDHGVLPEMKGWS